MSNTTHKNKDAVRRRGAGFWLASDTGRTDYVVTNDLAQNDTSVGQQVCNPNGAEKIEQVSPLPVISPSIPTNPTSKSPSAAMRYNHPL